MTLLTSYIELGKSMC